MSTTAYAYRKQGKVDLERLLDALNSLEHEVRAKALAALREHDPATRYYTLHDGRADAAADGH